MRKVILFIFNFLEVQLPAVIFVVLILAVSIQVFSRYVLNHPIAELFELSVYSFVWCIYLGAALAKRFDMHVRFDVIYRHLPEKARVGLDLVFDLITSVVLLFCLGPCWKYTLWAYKIKASALRIPWTFLLVCFPIFILLMIIHNGVSMVQGVRFIVLNQRKTEETPPWQ